MDVESDLEVLYRAAEHECQRTTAALAQNSQERTQLLAQQRKAFEARNALLGQRAVRRSA